MLVAAAAPAQTPPAPPALDLDAIVSAEWTAKSPGPLRWLDGEHYGMLETVGQQQRIVVRSAAGEDITVLASSTELVPDFRKEPLVVDDWTLSPDRRWLLLFTDSRRVWRANTRGDYWLFDLQSRQLRQLGGRATSSTLMFATFSPDSTRIAYVRHNDLYMEDLRNGVLTRLTRDGSPTLINGTFDWVYEEELGLRNGFRWSPDGRHIAFWQLDSSLVPEFVLVDQTSELYPQLQRFPYPKAGEINSAARLAVIPAGGGPTTWIDLPDSPRDNYPARMEWAGNEQLIVQRLNRPQNSLRLLLADAGDGKTRLVLEETDDAWVDVVDDLVWLDSGAAFTWSSERDGWRRIYRVARDGSSFQPLTPALTDVMSVERIDEAGGWLYYAASPDNPTQRYLYRVPLAPRGREPEAERVTPRDAPGTNTYDIAPGARWAVHTRSRFDDPPVIAIVALPEHRQQRVLADNAALRERWNALPRAAPEFFRVEISAGVELDAWSIVPPGLDRDAPARYPVLFHVYGEPAGQTVLDRWGGRNLLWHTWLASQGYVVMSVDNRGTPAPRGRDWRKIVYGEVGTLASLEQAEAARAILRARPWLDASRVGIWGWSGGGSMTLNALFRHPDLYAMGMAVAPVPDQRLYDTIYQERYMNTPQNNPDGYRRGSPITWAKQLRGKLLIVHGTGDDNVHYQGTERLIDELIRNGKQFTMMAYPNRSHGISEGTGTTRHLFGLLTEFLRANLPAGGPAPAGDLGSADPDR